MIDINSFKTFEKEKKLHNIRISGIFIWELCRNEVFLELIGKKQIKGHSLSIRNISILVLNFFISGFNLIKLFTLPKKIDHLFLLHPRKKIISNKKIDIYADPIISAFAKKKKSFCVVEKHSSKFLKIRYPRYDNFINLEIFTLFYKIKQKYFKNKISSEERLAINNLEMLIQNEFKVRIKIENLIQKKINEHKKYYSIFKFILKNIAPKKVFLTDSYHNSGILAACNELDLVSCELQHGSPIANKLNYDFSGYPKKYKPDYFFSFGDYFTNSLKLPLKRKNIISIGSAYLSSKKINNSKEQNKEIEKKILFLSQHNMTNEMLKFLKGFQKINDEFAVTVRNHPAEDINYLEKKFETEGISSIIFEDSRSIDLYESFNRNRICLGFFSTALFEATAFKKHVFSIKNSLVNIEENIIKNGEIVQIEYPKDLIHYLKFKKLTSKKCESFFMEFNEKKFLRIIENIK